MIDNTIIIILIFVLLFILKKFNVLKQISYGGRLESDFQGCYIISYPKSAELHNKGQAFDIDIDEFFRLNPKLKGKIPIEKRTLGKVFTTALMNNPSLLVDIAKVFVV